jgi:hypothetical protein
MRSEWEVTKRKRSQVKALVIYLITYWVAVRKILGSIFLGLVTIPASNGLVARRGEHRHCRVVAGYPADPATANGSGAAEQHTLVFGFHPPSTDLLI